MKRLLGLVVVSAGLLACTAAPKNARTASEVVVAPNIAPIAPLPPPPPDDPASEWHTYAPRPIEGGPFFKVVALNVSAPSMQGGPCSLREIAGGPFLECGSVARVDGEKIDTAFPSPSSTTTGLEGRYPDDLWARSYEGSYDDGMRPPIDSFVEGEHEWHHLEGGHWKRYGTAGDRHPYVDGSSLLFAMPPVNPDQAAKRPKSCADYACLRVLPRVLTNGTTKPDFSALKDRIAWLHHYDADEDVPDDYAFVVDPRGPVWVFMRALEIKTGKKGFGVARWTPSGGATFEWLPSSVSTKKRIWFSSARAKDGKVEIGISGDASTWLENDGKKWKESAGQAPSVAPEPEPTGNERFFAESGVLNERMPDGSSRVVPGIEDSQYLHVVNRAGGDTWVFTTDAVYRTIRPPETLYRTETFGSLHPFPKPLAEGESCAHPFAILDATEKSRAADLRRRAWDFGDVEAVELEVLDHVVVGVPVDSLEEGKKLLDDHHDYTGGRMMEGAPHDVVCARPIGAKPFVSSIDQSPDD